MSIKNKINDELKDLTTSENDIKYGYISKRNAVNIPAQPLPGQIGLTNVKFADDLIAQMASGMKSMIAHQMSEDIRHFSNKMIEKKRKGGL